MPHLAIKTIGIIGAGQMGTGIAIVAAVRAKLPVVLFDVCAKKLERQRIVIGTKMRDYLVLTFLDKMLDNDVEKGRMQSNDKEEALAAIRFTSSLDAISTVDFVVEAASEDKAIKKQIFKQLDNILADTVLVASNTSSISITELAAAYRKPSQFIGMHFMNPVPAMKLVELIPGAQTADSTISSTRLLAEKMGKTVTQSADVPGFIANRLLMPYINEAVFALYENIATRDDIDTTMKLGTNVPMGPLALADLIGLDTCLSIMRILHEELGDSKYRPCPLLVRYVNAGWLGKKSGRGFYDYAGK